MSAEGQDKIVQLVLDKVMERINSTNKLPWERPWKVVFARNYVTGREYTGINRWLLGYGEYLTFNKAKELGYILLPNCGKNYEVVVYKGKKRTPLYKDLQDKLINQHKSLFDSLGGNIESFLSALAQKGYIEEFEGKYFITSSFLRYYRVYEIANFVDAEGNPIESKVAEKIDHGTNFDAEKVIAHYKEHSGVQFSNSSGGAYYSIESDTVCVPQKEYFHTLEGYYQAVFHEMIHSTGATNRLARDLNGRGTSNKQEYSFEELIAEFGSSILMSRCGLDISKIINNTAAYIESWGKYFQNNPKDLLYAAAKAEKAVEYILGTTEEDEGEGE